MRRLGRETTPPRLLPLVPVLLIALLVGDGVFATAGYVWDFFAGDDTPRHLALIGAAISAMWVVVTSYALRIVVRWWVNDQPPRPGTRLRAGREAASEDV